MAVFVQNHVTKQTKNFVSKQLHKVIVFPIILKLITFPREM